MSVNLQETELHPPKGLTVITSI